MLRGSVNVIPEVPIPRIVELAVRAERLGFERCWVYDEGLATRDVHVTMAAILLATEHIKVGPGITNPFTRHPAQTAAAIASLDELSHGRSFLGIGAGGSLTLDPLAIDRAQPLAAVRDSIVAARQLFRGGPVDYDGRTLTLRSATLGYARPDIEIWLAGRGPQMLTLGGELCDGVMLDFIHKDLLGDVVAMVRRGAASTGNRPQICYSTAVVTPDDSLDDIRPHMTYRLVDAPEQVREMIGLPEADRARIRDAMRGGIRAAAEHVRDEWILPFVIAGSVQECGRELAGLMSRHGIDEYKLPLLSLDGAPAALDRMAEVLRAA